MVFRRLHKNVTSSRCCNSQSMLWHCVWRVLYRQLHALVQWVRSNLCFSHCLLQKYYEVVAPTQHIKLTYKATLMVWSINMQIHLFIYMTVTDQMSDSSIYGGYCSCTCTQLSTCAPFSYINLFILRIIISIILQIFRIVLFAVHPLDFFPTPWIHLLSLPSVSTL